MCTCLGVPRVPGNVGTEEVPRFHTQTVCAFRRLGNVLSGSCEKIDFRQGDESVCGKTLLLDALRAIFGVRVYIFDQLEKI
jgi:hypothetical protein